MDSIKCDRFKTFREELPSKKFQFLNEKNSIHKIKLIHEDSSNENKAIEAGVEIMKVEQEDQDTTPEPQQIAATGKFRDNLRRIDMVLVVEDNPMLNMDSLKIHFITNLVKTGLEIEVEPGLTPAHKNLSFIKIHAPDKVLTEYGEIFGVKRYFVENRLDLIGPKLTRIEKIFNIFTKNNEREWIKIVRKNYTTPNGYSNFERSLIVYKILLHLPFGDHINHYGINRLLRRNIILDAYALHDGPYFLIPNQSISGSNARQILYYSWTGIQNLFKTQPLHLIHEYFGPKVAFYFVFYGYLNKALAIASIGGIITLTMPFIDKGEDVLREIICNSNYNMCPYCVNWIRCPSRNLNEYCLPMTVNLMLDHPYTIYFSVFIVIWAFAFITFWKRKEKCLKWMWELGGNDLYYKVAFRPEFKVNYKPTKRSYKTGLNRNESGYYKFLRFLISKGIIIMYILSILPLMSITLKMHDKFFDAFNTEKKKEKWWDYIILAMFQTVYTLLVTLLEKIYHYLTYYIVNFENHMTYKAYENSLIYKQFGFSVTFMYPFMAYIAWMVGRNIFLGRCVNHMYFNVITYLHHRLAHWTISPWTPAECERYCWPFTCINELSVLLVVTLLIKQVIFRVTNYIFSLRTDYNRGSNINATIPCWEREYTLNSVDETFFTKKYLILAVQFSLITLFVVSFPLAPLLVLLVNIWDLRHTASQLLLASRRPLHIRNPSIGVWKNIFSFTAYAAIITNAITLVMGTRLTLRYFFQSRNKPLNSTLDFVLVYLRIALPYFDDLDLLEPLSLKNLSQKFFWYGLLDKLWPKSEFYLFTIYNVVFVILFVHIMALISFVIKYMFSPNVREIEEIKAAEKRLKTLYYHYKIVKDSKQNNAIPK